MADPKRFLGFMDMIDGGGAQATGDKFEGGGIFSALANLIATPYGSEDAGRRASREAALRAAGLLAMDTPKEAKVVRTGDGRPTPVKPTSQQLASARMAEMERKRGLEQDRFDPRGPNQMGSAVGMTRGTPITQFDPSLMAPATADPRNFAPNTQPMTLTPAQRGALGDRFDPRVQGGTSPAMAMVPAGMPAPAGSGVVPRQPMPESMPMERYMVPPSMIDVQPPAGMNLPQNATMARAMAALRQRFPNATPEQLANAAAMMGM